MDIFDTAGIPTPGTLGFGRPTAPNFGIPTSAGPNVPFDMMNDFPSLGGPTSVLSGGSAPGSNRPNFGAAILKDAHDRFGQDNKPSFEIRNDDFPALPGASSHPPGHSRDLNSASIGPLGPISGGADQNTHQISGDSGFGLRGEIGSVAVNQSSTPGLSNNNSGKSEQKRGIQTLKSGLVTNIPMGMVTDQFGMTGLLTFIRAAETEPKLVSLALGTDLTSLKLDLNSSENLYSNFAGPWSEQPLKPHEVDYPVPSEYLVYNQIRDKLATIREKIARYGEDTLFYLFYTFPNDILQIAAASELYNRDWRYHKDEKIWITRAPGMPPIEKTTTYERGTYYFFDPNNWRRVAKEFHLEYDRLENRAASAVLVNHLNAGGAGVSGGGSNAPGLPNSANSGGGGPGAPGSSVNSGGQVLPQGNLMVS